MPTPNNVMIDIETMGKYPGCAIVSIGAVVFDPRYHIVTNRTFYAELDLFNQELDGLVTDPETEEWWWKDQSKKAREALKGSGSLTEELKRLTHWLPKDCRVWGNGPSFDISILEHCYRLYNLPIPWKFWQVYDCRTIKYMYESKRGGFNRKVGGSAHNALGDAIEQATMVCKMWKELLT